MDYQSLNSKTVVELRALAKEMAVKIPSGSSKTVIIGYLLEAERAEQAIARPRKPAPEKTASGEAQIGKEREKTTASKEKTGTYGATAGEIRPRRGRPLAARRQTDEVISPEAPLPGGEILSVAKPERTRRREEAIKPVPAPTAEAPEKTLAGTEGSSAMRPERTRSRAEAVKPVARPMAEAPEKALVGTEGSSAMKPECTRSHVEAAKPVAPPETEAPEKASVGTEGSSAAGMERMRRQNYPAPVDARAVDNHRRPAHLVQSRQNFARMGGTDEQPRVETPVLRGNDENRRQYTPVRRAGEESQTVRRDEAPVRRDNYEFTPEGVPIGEFSDGSGLLELQQEGSFGMLRAENCLPGNRDIYISIAQIRRFNLRPGDRVEGKVRPPREGDRFGAMIYITKINGEAPEKAASRRSFETLIPLYPNERLRMESATGGELSLRMIDMLAPIGKGQRGMIVSPPKAGKTTLLKQIANAISDNNPEVELIVLLIDERPEEVTDMKRSIRGEVIYSTFDEAPENHARVSEMVLEHAQRVVEMGRDVVILMDSITRLARAYNLVIQPTGRSLSGGLDPGALYKPKRFFGAARNIENGGSLTIIATALVDTGSRMDDIIYEEFKGTGNMELHLDRKLSDKRIFPAIDMVRSGTRREELLLSKEELDGALQVRRMLSNSGSQESAEQLISLMQKTSTNADFFRKLKGWMNVYEKDGFSMGGK